MQLHGLSHVDRQGNTAAYKLARHGQDVERAEVCLGDAPFFFLVETLLNIRRNTRSLIKSSFILKKNDNDLIRVQKCCRTQYGPIFMICYFLIIFVLLLLIF